MNRSLRLYRGAFALALVWALSACGRGESGDGGGSTTVTSIAVVPGGVTLAVGKTQRLSAIATFEDGHTSAVTTGNHWISSAESVATVNAEGVVTAVADGSATVTVFTLGHQATALVSVATETRSLSSIAVAPNPLTLPAGAHQALSVIGTYSDGTTGPITTGLAFSSSDSAIAAVDEAGLVRGVAPGRATVTAFRGDERATVEVTVTAAALVSLELPEGPIALVIGQTWQLTVTGILSDSTRVTLSAGVTYQSSAEAIASVDGNGLVTAKSAGESTLTAMAQGLSQTVVVRCTEPTLTSVEVRPHPLNLAVGDTQQLSLAGIFEAGATRDLTASATWSTSDASVVSVSAAGLVKALKSGSATVSGAATVAGVTRSATASVTVVDKPAGYDPGAGWNLVWSDEFNGTAVDLNNWTFDIGSGGWGNQESQYYRAENAEVSGGMLTINAKVESFGDAPYTSARLQSSRKRVFTYGKFTMRAKLPYSQGMWPAFWLLGASSDSFGLYGGNVKWPGCGEADIMEMIGGLADGTGDYTTHGTLHYYNAGMRNPAPSYAYQNASKLRDDFHIYEMVWTPHSFTWKFDGLAYGTKVITADMEEFSQPMFMLLNLAIGGAWGGWTDASTVFPQKYVIDYVRVYSNASTVPGNDTPGLPTSWHLLNGAATGVSPAGETLSAQPGTVTGFQPLKDLTQPATWYTAPQTGRYEEGAWSVGIFTASPGAPAVVKVDVFVTAADGSAATSLGSAQLDVNKTGGGNHYSWFTLTGVPELHLSNQRLKLVVSPVSGRTATMVYNGNDFDSVITTPWSPSGP